MSRVAYSYLFVPGDRTERFSKAAASGAHVLVLDLEDAVAPAQKAHARDCVAGWLEQGHAATVRINAIDTLWYEDDVAMVGRYSNASVMLPKADAHSATHTLAALPHTPLIALLETVSAYMSLPALAQVAGVGRIAFGSVDFSADSGIADENHALTAVRAQIVLASRHAGLEPPIDGVSLELHDESLIRRVADESRALGFGGKLCIHPRQVAPVNAAWTPGVSELEWARRVVQAFEESAGGATSVDGKMIDKPVFERARRLLASVP